MKLRLWREQTVVLGCNELSSLIQRDQLGEEWSSGGAEREWKARSLGKKKSRHWRASVLKRSSLVIWKSPRIRTGKERVTEARGLRARQLGVHHWL